MSSNNLIARSESLRDQVFARLLENISRGELGPGGTLTESDLTQAFGVSRTPAREALLKLSDSGLIEPTEGRGFRVRAISAADATDLYQCIWGIEQMAVKNGVFDAIWAQSVRKVLEQASASGSSVTERWGWDRAFHTGIVAAAHNAQLMHLSDHVRNCLSRYIVLYMERDQWRGGTLDEHHEIVTALEVGRRDQACALIEEHWTTAMHKVIGWLEEENR